MSDYYPAGVTGRERVFGPDFEAAEERDCQECDFSGLVDVSIYGQTESFTCPNGHLNETMIEPDPDEYYDRMREEG